MTKQAKHGAFAVGLGMGTWSASGVLLEVWFPVVLYQPADALVLALQSTATLAADQTSVQLDAEQLAAMAQSLKANKMTAAANTAKTMAAAEQDIIFVLLPADVEPADTASAYLKLHLLSLRHVAPNKLNLNNIFSVLPNVAWTSEGAMLPEELPARRLAARLAGRRLTVTSLDKFPCMTDYITPPGVRIADTRRVRLGAHLGADTTVMHEGFVNFNAGTLGVAMVEGRISQGVTLGENSDLGGSASTLGTLSGGGNIVVSIGRNCLIGANAGTGIPLGDNCTIEAGLYITAGMRIAVMDKDGNVVDTVKARALAGQSDMLFIRHSSSGRIECRTNQTAATLNTSLHAHN